MEKSAYDPDHLIAPRIIVPTPTTMISIPQEPTVMMKAFCITLKKAMSKEDPLE